MDKILVEKPLRLKDDKPYCNKRNVFQEFLPVKKKIKTKIKKHLEQWKPLKLVSHSEAIFISRYKNLR